MPRRRTAVRALLVPFLLALAAAGLASPSLGARRRQRPPAAPATLVSISLKPGARTTRLHVRCTAAVKVIWGRLRQPERVFVDLTGARLGRAPRQVLAEGGGVPVVRARQAAKDRVRLEAELDRRCEVRLAADGSRREVALDFVTEEKERQPGRLPVATALKQVAAAGAVSRVLGIAFFPTAKGIDLEIRGSGPIRALANRLGGDNPRFYLDLQNARLAVPGLPEAPKDAPVRGVRARQSSELPATCRVVLDLHPGATAQVLPQKSPQVLRIAVRGTAPSDLGTGRAAGGKGGTSTDVALRVRGTIALDPGHGGLDSGAINTPLGLQEKTVALDIAHRVRGILEKQGYRVAMSRTGDERLRPTQRIEWLQGVEADLLISIHCDSIDGRADWNGVTTYFRAGSEEGRDLAAAIQETLVQATGTPDRGVRRDTTRYESGFYLLQNARQPAVLVETGYISNPEMARKFNDPGFRQQIARGIAAGLGAYLKERPVREVRR